MGKEDKKRYNRAILLIIVGIFLMLWVMINAGTWTLASIIYAVIGIFGIFFYLTWNKIGTI